MNLRIVLVGMILFGCGRYAQATVMTYDVADDWSISNANPNGAWTYGKYTGGVDASTFVAYNTPGTVASGGAAGLQTWSSSGASDPCATYNPTDTVLSDWGIIWNPKTFGMSPYAGPAVARWSAPLAGTADWSAMFAAWQSGDPAPYVYAIHNSTTLAASAERIVFGTPTTLSGSGLTVAAGDTIDFVMDGTKFTGLDATIALTTVPEPSSMVALVCGLVGLLANAWRKKS